MDKLKGAELVLEDLLVPYRCSSTVQPKLLL